MPQPADVQRHLVDVDRRIRAPHREGVGHGSVDQRRQDGAGRRRAAALLPRAAGDDRPLPLIRQRRTLDAKGVLFDAVDVHDLVNRWGQSENESHCICLVEDLFGEMSTACDFVDLAQNGFGTRPVAPLQGSLGHRSCASLTVSRLRIHSQNRFSAILNGAVRFK